MLLWTLVFFLLCRGPWIAGEAPPARVKTEPIAVPLVRGRAPRDTTLDRRSRDTKDDASLLFLCLLQAKLASQVTATRGGGRLERVFFFGGSVFSTTSKPQSEPRGFPRTRVGISTWIFVAVDPHWSVVLLVQAAGGADRPSNCKGENESNQSDMMEVVHRLTSHAGYEVQVPWIFIAVDPHWSFVLLVAVAGGAEQRKTARCEGNNEETAVPPVGSLHPTAKYTGKYVICEKNKKPISLPLSRASQKAGQHTNAAAARRGRAVCGGVFSAHTASRNPRRSFPCDRLHQHSLL